MSGIEIAGIVVGSWSAAVQLLGGRKAVAAIVRNNNHFQKLDRTLRNDLFVEENIFKRECRRMLSHYLGVEEADSIFQNESLERWQDAEWESQLQQHLRGDYEVAIKAIEGVVEALDATRRTLASAGCLQENESHEADEKISKISLRQTVKMGKRETKLGDRLVALRTANERLKRVVDSSLPAVPTGVSDLRRGPANSHYSPSIKISTIRTVQDVSMLVYNALRSAGRCECHDFNLRLEFELGKTSLERSPTFQLLAIFKSGDAMLHQSMDVEGSPSMLRDHLEKILVKRRKVVLPKPNRNVLDDELLPKPQSPGGKVVEEAKVRKQVGFTFSMAEEPLKRCRRKSVNPLAKLRRAVEGIDGMPRNSVNIAIDSSSESSETTSGESSDESAPAANEKSATFSEIETLCDCLNKKSAREGSCLGYVRDSDEHEVMIFSSEPPPAGQNSSLQGLLKENSGLERLSTRDRFRLAFTIALSVVELHMTPWIKQKWGSGDVLLFPEYVEDSRKLSPYVAVAFGSMSQVQDSRNTSATPATVGNACIFSLGVVLLEIGRHQLLPTQNLPLLQMNTEHEEIRKRLAAVELVSGRCVADEMGPGYHRVVRNCIHWSQNGIGENLKDERVLKRFYELVVCQLERCMLAFEQT